MKDLGFGPVTRTGSTIIGEEPSGSVTPSSAAKDNTGMIIGIVLGAAAIVCLAIVSSVFYMRKKAKIGQFDTQEIPMDS